MSLKEIDLSVDIEAVLPASILSLIDDARQRIQAFQDRWDRRPIEQFVASDFSLVYQWIDAIGQQRLVAGNRFCEWGCGFGVVSCLASQLKWDTIGIEAEADLIAEARKFSSHHNVDVELWHGNLLPRGSDDLSYDPTLPSLGHPEHPVYDEIGLNIDDFDLIFAYPWPGEGSFLEDVFDRYAAVGSCFLTFCGPYEMRLVRKVSSRR